MARWIKMLVTKPENLSLILDIYIVKKQNNFPNRLSSDVHMCAMVGIGR